MDAYMDRCGHRRRVVVLFVPLSGVRLEEKVPHMCSRYTDVFPTTMLLNISSFFVRFPNCDQPPSTNSCTFDMSFTSFQTWSVRDAHLFTQFLDTSSWSPCSHAELVCKNPSDEEISIMWTVIHYLSPSSSLMHKEKLFSPHGVSRSTVQPRR